MSHISLKSIEKILMILLGNLLYSFAIAFFILPSGLITGGTTGIALFVYLYLQSRSINER